MIGVSSTGLDKSSGEVKTSG